ncbi:unnamed protein product, partial [Rotaria sp. Silwood2]
MWPSPWGLGRPSGNIGCGVMINTVLDKHFDIHTDVIDFEFLARGAEISHLKSTNSWFSYFHHDWRLNIPECKMLKSSKTFITFEQALEKYGFQQLRLLCLLHFWSSTLDNSDDEMKKALTYEVMLNKFFRNVKKQLGIFEISSNSNADTEFDEHGRTLHEYFST